MVAGGAADGRISYAALGINQMGAVYEPCLVTAVFAEERLYEVKRARDTLMSSMWLFVLKRIGSIHRG